jgi:molybdopterin biosynthesis enzyme
MYMLKALAEADVKAVPVVRKRSVMVLSVVDEPDSRMAEVGKRLYAAVVVRTMRKVSRGLVKERYAANLRLIDDCGREDPRVVS